MQINILEGRAVYLNGSRFSPYIIFIFMIYIQLKQFVVSIYKNNQPVIV